MEEIKSEFYTGEKKKKLLVHVLQNGVEVSKPIKKKIYDQYVTWEKRQYPIVPSRFVYDFKGIAHQYVESNDVAVLTFNKDHEDKCKKCGGRMTIDARQARELGKSRVFHAIWGIDSTHMILLIVIAVGAMAMAGFGVYYYGQDSTHNAQLQAEKLRTGELRAEIDRLNLIINPPIDPNAPDNPNR